MPLVHVFADEAGCFRFDRSQSASRYFILTTIKCSTCDIGTELLDFKRSLARRGIDIGDRLHASSDTPAIRDEVFKIILNHEFRTDCTILEKSKAQPQTRADEATFYRYAWYYHGRHITPRFCVGDNDVLVTAAALATNAGKAAFKLAFNNAIQQTMPRNARLSTAFPLYAADPCLWAADYCCWAIQRKWERNDQKQYNLIAHTIRSEYNLWQTGEKQYY
jgi:hypothetical protein